MMNEIEGYKAEYEVYSKSYYKIKEENKQLKSQIERIRASIKNTFREDEVLRDPEICASEIFVILTEKIK